MAGTPAVPQARTPVGWDPACPGICRVRAVFRVWYAACWRRARVGRGAV